RETILLGNIQPGDFSVTFDALVIAPCSRFEVFFSAEWGEIGSPSRKTEIFEFDVLSQATGIDWQSLEYRTPYSREVAEGADFIGRAEKVRLLAAKLLRQPMESFYITGQKRVGKTSLALAAAEFAKGHSPNKSLDFRYVLWGSIVHAEPIVSMEQLGQNV